MPCPVPGPGRRSGRLQPRRRRRRSASLLSRPCRWRDLERV